MTSYLASQSAERVNAKPAVKCDTTTVITSRSTRTALWISVRIAAVRDLLEVMP